MNPAERVLQQVDHAQRRYAPLSFLWAVNKKYGDDNGGSLATLLTYNAFLALFPLLLVLVTVLGMVAGSSSHLTHEVVGSALRQFPVIGTQLGANIHALHRDSTIGLLVGIGGLLWGSLGAAQSGQYAMAEVWNIPKTRRPGYLPRLVRSVAVLCGLGLFLVVSTGLSTVATDTAARGLVLRMLVALATLLVNVAMMAMAFRALTPRAIGARQLLPGVVVAGVGWSVLQGSGAYLVAHDLRDDTAIYGFFAVVLGALAWLYLTMRLVLYAAEINVVWDRRLWPRALRPPLTAVDHHLLITYIEQEERRPEVGAAGFVRPPPDTASPVRASGKQPALPSDEPSAPHDNHPSPPSDGPSAAGDEPSAPDDHPSPPSVRPSAAGDEPSAPDDHPSPPSVRPSAAGDEPCAPDDHPSWGDGPVLPGTSGDPTPRTGDQCMSTPLPQRIESYFTGSPGELGTVQRRPAGPAAEHAPHPATTVRRPRRQP